VPQSGSPGVKFASSSGKSDLEWTIHRAARTPGPGEYAGVARAHALCVRSSPHFSMAGRTGPATLPSPYANLHPNPRTQRSSHSRGALPARAEGEGAERGEDSEGATGPGPGSRIQMPAVGQAGRGAAEHAERVKAACVRASMTRKWRAHPGFGRSFFI
jgi:hypothetical protein